MIDYGKRQRRYGQADYPSHSDELPVNGSGRSA